MKKILIIVLGIFILMGGVFAISIEIINKDKTIDLSDEVEIWYKNNNMDLLYKDYTNNKRCLIFNSVETICSENNLTEEELDLWQVNELETLAQFQIYLENEIKPEVKQGGRISFGI